MRGASRIAAKASSRRKNRMRLFQWKPSGPEESLQLCRRDEDGDGLGTDVSAADGSVARLKAFFLAALSGLAFTYCAATARLLRRLSPAEVLLFRTGVQSVLTAPAAACSLRRDAAAPPWFWVVSQGGVMAASLQLLFVSFQRLPLGDASALVFSAPALVCLMSWALLGERPTAWQATAVAGVVAGGAIVCRAGAGAAPPGEWDAAGAAAAVAGTIGYSLHYVLMRRLRAVAPSLNTLCLSAQTFALSGVILLIGRTFQVPVDALEWTLLVTSGAAGAAAHVLLSMALGMQEAATVAATRSLDIAVAYAVQVTVCGDPPTPLGIAGAALVCACVIFIAWAPPHRCCAV